MSSTTVPPACKGVFTVVAMCRSRIYRFVYLCGARPFRMIRARSVANNMKYCELPILSLQHAHTSHGAHNSSEHGAPKHPQKDRAPSHMNPSFTRHDRRDLPPLPNQTADNLQLFSRLPGKASLRAIGGCHGNPNRQTHTHLFTLFGGPWAATQRTSFGSHCHFALTDSSSAVPLLARLTSEFMCPIAPPTSTQSPRAPTRAHLPMLQDLRRGGTLQRTHSSSGGGYGCA